MAKKPSITTVASGYQSTTTINSNTQNLRDAFDNTLSLDGSTPNAMLADFDMNSNDIINVDKLYLSGLYIDGQPVAPGTLNYNGVIKETQTATSGQTVFNLTTMTYNPGINSLSVYVDGVYQNPSTYTENTTTRITFSAGLHVGAIVDFVALSINEITGGADATTITYTPLQSLYGSSTITVKSALDQISNEGTGSSKVGFLQSGTGTTNRSVQSKLRDTVSVKDFGAVGDGINDDTAAIQAALNSTETRLIYFPAGRYKITSSLVLNQNAILEGCGSNDELNNFTYDNITTIEINGDFDGLTINPAAPSYYGYITIKNLKVTKVSGNVTLNRGIYAQNFAPNLVLERVSVHNFGTGFDLFTGIAQINACVARNNVTGFRIQSTSTTLQNCYAFENTTGYLFVLCVYTSLIALAADKNTTAYKFDTGSTGPFTFQEAANIVDMIDCGAEIATTYMYVNGNWSITCSSPSVDSITQCFYIESARNIILRNLSLMRPRANWLYVNTAKCPPDTVVVEGEMPPQNQAVPSAPTYSNVPVAMSAFKTQVGVLGLAKTRLPPMDMITGLNAANGVGSYLYKGKFTARIGPANSLRFTVTNGANGFRSGGWANLVFYTNGAPAPTDRGGMIYMQTQNVGGVSYAATSDTADVTVTSTDAVIGGVTYTYFTITRAAGDVWAYVDTEAFTNFEPFQSDMFTIYNAWQVSQL